MLLSDDFPMALEREAGMPEWVSQVAVAFGMYPHLDPKRSQEAGHEVYKDVPYVKIAVPGDRQSVVFQPATDDYKRRFPTAWAKFEAREKRDGTEGMRIEQWAAISRGVAMTLKAVHIHTVESLAEVHDGNIDRIGLSNARELREKARAWLAQAQDSAATLRAAAEKKELQDQLASRDAQMAAMAQRLEELEKSQKPGRRRADAEAV